MSETRQQSPLSQALRANRALLLASAALAGALNALDLVVPPLGVPAAVVFVWLVLRASREGWAGIGLVRPESWPRTLGLALGAAVLLQALVLFAVLPALRALGLELPDLSRFEAIRGSLPVLFVYLAVSWTTAGFGEEVIWRGFTLGRLARVLGRGRGAWIAALLLTSGVFGLLHAYQGATGMVLTGFAGLVLGSLYLATGRNLWVSIIAHAMTDTLSFLLIYSGLFQRLV